MDKVKLGSGLDLDLEESLSMLTRIVNGAGKSRQTSAETVVTADVPVALLKLARDLLEKYRDTEYGTDAMRHATNRVWG